MTTHVLGDTGVLTGRSLRHILRSPDTIITTAVTPIALMLLFVYVFGGAINTGSDESYIDYMLPGILLITIASSIAYTAFRLFTDMQSGIFERFQSMPIARSSVLWGHVLTSLVSNLVSVAIVVGVVVAVVLRSSRFGFSLRAAGLSLTAAAASGIPAGHRLRAVGPAWGQPPGPMISRSPAARSSVQPGGCSTWAHPSTYSRV